MLNFLTPQEVLTEVAGCLQERLLPVVADPVSRRQLRAAIFLTSAVAEALPRLQGTEQSTAVAEQRALAVSLTAEDSSARVGKNARGQAMEVLDWWIELQPLNPALGGFEPLGIDLPRSRTPQERSTQP